MGKSAEGNAIMINRLLRKLSGYVWLSEADRLCLAEFVSPGRRIAAHTDITHGGDDPRAVNVILDGWACRYRQFANGHRQIVALLLPGDLYNPPVSLLGQMDHTIGVITPMILGQISGPALQAMTARHPDLGLALHREALVTAAVQREWTFNLGSRAGIERLAHLMCEIHARMEAVGLTEANTCPLPMTQSEIGEALGQTSVHINRTLQELRGMGLITFNRQRLTIHDPVTLARIALFTPSYLRANVAAVHR